MVTGAIVEMETVKSDAGCPELDAGFCTANGITHPSGVDLGGGN